MLQSFINKFYTWLMSIFREKLFVISLSLFFILNISIYLFILTFNNIIPFNKFNYIYNAHHYFEDGRIKGEQFNILRALGQYDAQWYLKIASDGYPTKPKVADIGNKKVMEGLSYAFFPLYPLTLSSFNLLFKNTELSAFIVSNILLLLNFASLYFVISKLFSKKLAIKTAFLIFTFPFAIFFRSYFAEGLQLFLLIWFGYFLVKKRWLRSALLLSLLNLTNGNTILINLIYIYYFWKEKKGKYGLDKRLFLILSVISVPFLFWVIFNYFNTGNPLYFYTIHNQWFKSYIPILPLFWNMALLVLFPFLSLHSFHSSMIDLLTVILILVFLFKSKKFLGEKLWWISFLLWLTPLLVKDTLAYTRLEIISFPIAIYLAKSLNNIGYLVVLILFTTGLFFTSILFVNWYWLG